MPTTLKWGGNDSNHSENKTQVNISINHCSTKQLQKNAVPTSMGHTQGKRELSVLGAEDRAEWEWVSGGSKNPEEAAIMILIL